MSTSFTDTLLALLGQMDYKAIFILMAAESSIIPVPSEIVMIPAGYLSATGHLNFWLVLLAGSLGSVAGSVISYYLAWGLGRPLLARFGRYFLIREHHLLQAEQFIHAHGEIAIFSGRFIPGIRHLISLPAGLVTMALNRFMLYTFLGAGLWNAVLELLGYLIGDHQAWMKANGIWVMAGAMTFAASTVLIYILIQRRKMLTKTGEIC